MIERTLIPLNFTEILKNYYISLEIIPIILKSISFDCNKLGSVKIGPDIVGLSVIGKNENVWEK